MITRLKSEIHLLVAGLIRNIPGSLGWRLRQIFYKNKFRTIGEKVSFDTNTYIRGANNISLGDNIGFGIFTQLYCDDLNSDAKIQIGSNCNFNSNVMINADNEGFIEIGNNVIVGPNVVIRASNHNFDNLNEPIKKQGHKPGKVIIEDNVWIGANVVLLSNIRISSDSIIAAGSVVSKSIPKGKIAAGIPARVIKSR